MQEASRGMDSLRGLEEAVSEAAPHPHCLVPPLCMSTERGGDMGERNADKIASGCAMEEFDPG